MSVISHPIIDAYINQTGPEGYVQPHAGKGSQNGQYFTALALLALKRHGYLEDFRARFTDLFKRTEVVMGVHHRSPTNTGDQNSVDNYIGIAFASYLLDQRWAKRWLAHGRIFDWSFDNVETYRTSEPSAYMGRFPGLIANHADGSRGAAWTVA